jgi:hypothetical protein
MIKEQISSFGNEMTKFVGNGMPIADAKKYEERIKICRQCELFDRYQRRCRKCGCFMLVKARMATASCPEKKW